MYKYFCLLCPNPTPNSPPEPIAYNPCITCHPPSVASDHGSKNVVNLVKRKSPFPVTCASISIPKIPNEPSETPAVKKYLNLVPAINIIIDIIPIIIIEALKWSCIKNNMAIGGNKYISGLTNPVKNEPNSFL